MKRILMVLAIGAVLGGTACKKCKDCTSTVKQNGAVISTQTAEYCDDDLEEVDGQTVTQTVTDPFSGTTISQEVSYSCK